MSGDEHGVVRTAAVLVRIAVLFLPSAQRDRYTEEFLSELLTQSGRQQVRHGLMLVCTAWSLRRGLVVSTADESNLVPRSRNRFFATMGSTAAVVVLSLTGVRLMTLNGQAGHTVWDLTNAIFAILVVP